MRDTFAKRYTKTTATIFSLVLFAIAGGLAIFVGHTSKDAVYWRFTNDTKPTTGYIGSQMNIYSNVLYGIRALFDASETVEPDEWRQYVQALDLVRNYPGVSSLFYAPKTAPQDSVVTVYPQTKDMFVYPITYIEPYDQTKAKAVGFNLASESNRLTAMNEAVRTDQPTATPMILSVVTGTPIISIYIPIYKNGTKSSYQERKETIEGFGTVSFRIGEIFNYFIDHMAMNEHIRLQVYDTGSLFDASPSTLLFDSTPDGITEDTLLRTDTVTVAGRPWLLVYTALPGYESSQNPLPTIIWITGILFSLLLPFSLYYWARYHEISRTSVE